MILGDRVRLCRAARLKSICSQTSPPTKRRRALRPVQSQITDQGRRERRRTSTSVCPSQVNLPSLHPLLCLSLHRPSATRLGRFSPPGTGTAPIAIGATSVSTNRSRHVCHAERGATAGLVRRETLAPHATLGKPGLTTLRPDVLTAVEPCSIDVRIAGVPLFGSSIKTPGRSFAPPSVCPSLHFPSALSASP